MKKILITLAVIIGILLVLFITIPLFLKGNITEIIEKQSAKYLNADVRIEKIDLSMFKSFPALNVDVKQVTVIGKGEFAGDTLVHAPLLRASVNLMSLIKGDEIIIQRILLKDAQFKPLVSAKGLPNWDILIQKEPAEAVPLEEVEKTKEGTHKALQMNDLTVENLSLSYADLQTTTFAEIGSMQLNFSGNLSETRTLLDIILHLEDISFRQGNNVWIQHTDLNWEASIAANLKEMEFNIQKNNLSVNDLQLDLTGKISKSGDRIGMDIQLNAPDTRFENLLALLPKQYQEYLKGIKTAGDFTLKARAKGEYYTDHLPLLDIQFAVNNGEIKYPQLSQSLHQINMQLHITNPGGPADSTLFDLNQLSFSIGGNPFTMHLSIAGLEDPRLQGGAKGVIDFSRLKQALPLGDISLQGIVTTDLAFNGKYSFIEQKKYEKFTTKGSILLNNILFINSEFPEGISIPNGTIVITPASLELNNFRAKIYSSDFSLKGNLSNYIPYLLKNETLKGNFLLTSDRVNLNKFVRPIHQASDTTTFEQEKEETIGQAPQIPHNLDIQLNTNIKTLLIDRLTVQNLKGKIRLAQSAAMLNNLSMDLLKGQLAMSGEYNTRHQALPRFDLQLKVTDFDIQEAYNSFSFIKKSIPIAMNCSGKISSNLQLSGGLNYRDMSLLMNTVNGEGDILSKGILVTDNPGMKNLASILKNEELSRLSISSLHIFFKINNGNITIEPFKTTLAGNPVTISGTQSVNGNIDYTLSMNVDRKYFGKDIENLLQAIPGSGNIKSLDIDAKITGTLEKPEVKPDLTKAINAVRKAAEKDLKNKALKGFEKLFK